LHIQCLPKDDLITPFLKVSKDLLSAVRQVVQVKERNLSYFFQIAHSPQILIFQGKLQEDQFITATYQRIEDSTTDFRIGQFQSTGFVRAVRIFELISQQSNSPTDPATHQHSRKALLSLMFRFLSNQEEVMTLRHEVSVLRKKCGTVQSALERQKMESAEVAEKLEKQKQEAIDEVSPSPPYLNALKFPQLSSNWNAESDQLRIDFNCFFQLSRSHKSIEAKDAEVHQLSDEVDHVDRAPHCLLEPDLPKAFLRMFFISAGCRCAPSGTRTRLCQEPCRSLLRRVVLEDVPWRVGVCLHTDVRTVGWTARVARSKVG
jgi:hypothetical protein